MTRDKQFTLSVHQAAEILGVTPTTVYGWVREKEIPSVRLGGRIRIPTALLAQLLGVEVNTLLPDGQVPDEGPSDRSG